MGLTSLQVCMDSSDWLQGSIHEDTGLELDSSSPSGDMLTCSRPLIERKLRPPQEALKCPRCDSTHTKFCYYNNYSLTQPRYFCKTCRRYWTKGGTLRNIPVGGGCRKNNKKVSSKKSNDHQSINQNPRSSSPSSSLNPTDLHLSYPEMQFSHHFGNILGSHGTLGNPNFMLENPRNYDFMGNGDMGMIGGLENLSHHHHQHGSLTPYVHNICSPFGVSLDGNGGTYIDTCQRLVLPYEDQNAIDVKPNSKLLSLNWQDQTAGCSDVGYLGNLGSSSWSGMINGYGSSAANSHLLNMQKCEWETSRVQK